MSDDCRCDDAPRNAAYAVPLRMNRAFALLDVPQTPDRTQPTSRDDHKFIRGSKATYQNSLLSWLRCLLN